MWPAGHPTHGESTSSPRHYVRDCTILLYTWRPRHHPPPQLAEHTSEAFLHMRTNFKKSLTRFCQSSTDHKGLNSVEISVNIAIFSSLRSAVHGQANKTT